jgi:formamidopyrimidine-DNA glycosylase
VPELPEVETTRRGIAPHLVGQRVQKLVVREPRLRWPVSRELAAMIEQRDILDVSRRAKYLLLRNGQGTLIIHLGMSGSLSIVDKGNAAGPHDHIDLILTSDKCLRYNDPRRFGCWLWTSQVAEDHELLRNLGPEPLAKGFTGAWLFEHSRGRRVAIKNFLMNSHIVAGVGNIYANEALFRAGIHPARAAGRIGRTRFEALVTAVRDVLQLAISQGGTTLRDFVNGEGKPGYFQQSLQVYGRTGRPCPKCESPVRESRIGQRSTFYCPRCQR